MSNERVPSLGQYQEGDKVVVRHYGKVVVGSVVGTEKDYYNARKHARKVTVIAEGRLVGVKPRKVRPVSLF